MSFYITEYEVLENKTLIYEHLMLLLKSLTKTFENWKNIVSENG